MILNHTSRYIQSFFAENDVTWWMSSAESPDLNPIEKVWGSMKTYLGDKYKPRTLPRLKEGIRTYWSKLTPLMGITWLSIAMWGSRLHLPTKGTKKQVVMVAQSIKEFALTGGEHTTCHICHRMAGVMGRRDLSTFTSSNFSVADPNMEPKQNTQNAMQGIHVNIPLSR